MTIRIRLSNDWAPGLHHGEAGLHEHHQGAAQDQPEAENAVDWVVIIEINEENLRKTFSGMFLGLIFGMSG
jgi:hypothetical protein